MPPPRDAFSRALAALRLRLRQGVDAPGDALPIHLIAAELRLSATPVREVLSRLAGEGLVEKRGPVYTRPRLDGPTLSAVYNLRLTYLLAALASGGGQGADRRGLAPRARPDLPGELARGVSPVVVIEALFVEVILAADDPVLVQAYQQVADRLAPFQAVETRVAGDLAPEAAALVAAVEDREAIDPRTAVRRYHRRLMARADLLARLAGDEKYRTDIV